MPALWAFIDLQLAQTAGEGLGTTGIGLYVLIILRLIHIVAGSLWVGAVVFIQAVLLPAQKRAGADSERFTRPLLNGGITALMLGVATGLNLMSGIALYAYRASRSEGWASSHAAIAYGIGGGLAVLGSVLFYETASSSRQELRALRSRIVSTQSTATEFDLVLRDGIRARVEGRMNIAAGILLLATGVMAVARYL